MHSPPLPYLGHTQGVSFTKVAKTCADMEFSGRPYQPGPGEYDPSDPVVAAPMVRHRTDASGTPTFAY
jgi:hypothetical protein